VYNVVDHRVVGSMPVAYGQPRSAQLGSGV
jgi:hypothetical protein